MTERVRVEEIRRLHAGLKAAGCQEVPLYWIDDLLTALARVRAVVAQYRVSSRIETQDVLDAVEAALEGRVNNPHMNSSEGK